jgi:hypothetical protein
MTFTTEEHRFSVARQQYALLVEKTLVLAERLQRELAEVAVVAIYLQAVVVRAVIPARVAQVALNLFLIRLLVVPVLVLATAEAEAEAEEPSPTILKAEPVAGA